MDVLADVLSSTGFRGSLLAQVRSTGPGWGCALDRIDTAGFHLIAEGVCWLRTPDSAPLQLVSGDVALLPRGTPHELLGEPDAQARPLGEAPVRKLLTGGEVIEVGGVQQAAGSASVRIVCGKFEYATPTESHPVLSALPEVVHVPGMASDPQLQGVVRLLASESSNGQPGSRSVATRLTEVLFVLAVRNWLSLVGDAGEGPSWLTALRDPRIGSALSLMHETPEREWSVETLAHEVAMSRPAFARHFKSVVGTTPLAYLSGIRLDRAAQLLRDTDHSLDEIARTVGYTSEFTFSRAFARERGVAPGRYRRRSADAGSSAVNGVPAVP